MSWNCKAFSENIIAPEDLFGPITDEEVESALFRDTMKVAFSPDKTAVEPDSPHLGTQNQTQRPETDEELKLYAKRSETEGFVSRANRLGLSNN